MTAKEIMKPGVITISEDASVQDLAALLAKKKISGAPVVDDQNRVVGIVSEGDLVSQDADIHFPHYIELLGNIIYLESVKKYEERLEKAAASSVRDIMTADVVTVQENAELHEIATLMTERQVNRVPVLDGDVLVGIITRADVVRAMARG
ncbi:MAG: CBS domain-containing protein [Thermoleophilia bacterium]|nr:CBS domain-containing protein [Thermoleophilia bacterium]